MAQSSFDRHDPHTTTSHTGWSTRRIALTALFCAVAAVATLFIEFPLLPGLTFLKYDPSGIVALVAGFAFGPATAAVVSILPYLVHLATESGIYGTLMAVLATFSLVMPAAAIYQHHPTLKGAIAGMCIGALVSLAACIGGNLVLTPLYMGTDIHTVIGLIVPALLPFNIIKILINCVVGFAVYKPISHALCG